MKMTLEMSRVKGCEIGECAYNVEAQCHAKAITIGHDGVPGCDTYCRRERSTHVDSSLLAGVGACKVSECVHNFELECGASDIRVGTDGDRINCLTYAKD